MMTPELFFAITIVLGFGKLSKWLRRHGRFACFGVSETVELVRVLNCLL